MSSEDDFLLDDAVEELTLIMEFKNYNSTIVTIPKETVENSEFLRYNRGKQIPNIGKLGC